VDTSVDVERVIKGTVQPGQLISVVWVSPFGVPDGAYPKDHGILFMHNTPSGAWEILPVANGHVTWLDAFIRTPITPAPAGTLSDTDLDKVLRELVAAIKANSVPVPVDLAAIHRTNRSPILDKAFREFAVSTDAKLMTLGHRGLISVSDTSVVQSLHQNFQTLHAAPFWLPLVDEIKYQYTNASPVAVRGLGSLVTDQTSPAELRLAAATALARVHSRESLPYLAELLDDSHQELKALAVGGLASFANNVPVGGHDPAAGEWKYHNDATIAHSSFSSAPPNVAFWKTWWLQNNADLAH